MTENGPMRRWLGIGGAIVVLGLAYWAWPLVGAAQLAQVARSGDAGQVFERVDVDRLRRSLSRQIAVAYLDVSGKGKKMGALGRSLAGAAVTTVADPYVAQLLTPGNVMSLLSQGRIAEVRLGDRAVAVKGALPNFSTLVYDHILSTIINSYFDGLTDFVIPIERGSGSTESYGVHLHLVGVSWKLAGLDLPAAVVKEMAQSILAGEATPTL